MTDVTSRTDQSETTNRSDQSANTSRTVSSAPGQTSRSAAPTSRTVSSAGSATSRTVKTNQRHDQFLKGTQQSIVYIVEFSRNNKMYQYPFGPEILINKNAFQ